MAKFNLEVDPLVMGQKILEDEQVVFGKEFKFRGESKPANVMFPEFIGHKGTFQMNTVDGITNTSRRIKIIADAKRPTGTIYINDIDVDAIQLVEKALMATDGYIGIEREDDWENNAQVINEFITILHLRRIALAIWYPNADPENEEVKFFNHVGLIGFLLRTIFPKSGYSVGYEETEDAFGNKTPCVNIYSGNTILYALGVHNVEGDPWSIVSMTRRHRLEVSEMALVETLLLMTSCVINSLEAGLPVFKNNTQQFRD
jgi:hypothetical protein